MTGDGDYRLVVADLGSGDFNMKLRVYKGTQQVYIVFEFRDFNIKLRVYKGTQQGYIVLGFRDFIETQSVQGHSAGVYSPRF